VSHPVPTERDTPRAGAKEWTALLVLALGVFLLAVDGTVLSLAIPALSADLDPSATELLWIGDIYSFVLAGLLVTMGTLGDRIGRKKLLLIGAAGFGSASLLAAFAPTSGWLIAARALLGIAGATLMPSTLSIIRNLFHDSKQRTKAIAVWSAMAASGAAAGPLVGGILLEHFWWGSVFIINIPVMAAMIGLGIFLIPESKDPNPGPFDLVSAGLSVVGIVALVYGVKEFAAGGDPMIATVAVVLGVLALGWFVRRQQTLAVPLIDITLFRNRAFSGAVVGNLIGIFALSGLLFFLSQYLQLVLGYGPLEAGLREMPAALASIAVIAVVAVLVARIGRGRSIGLGLGLSAVGLVLVAVAEGSDNYLWLAIALILTGAGIGIALTLSTDAVVSAVPKDKAGAASAVSETAYEMGVALGIAVLGSILSALYRSGLAIPAGTPQELAAHADQSLAAVVGAAQGQGEAGRQVVGAAQDAFVHAMQVTSFIAAGLLLIAAVITWRIIPARTAEEIEEAQDG